MIDAAAARSREPYPVLVRARLALGWDPAAASTTPFTPKARLTPAEVQQVRTSTTPAAELAATLRISVRQVQRIRAGERWKAA